MRRIDPILILVFGLFTIGLAACTSAAPAAPTAAPAAAPTVAAAKPAASPSVASSPSVAASPAASAAPSPSASPAVTGSPSPSAAAAARPANASLAITSPTAGQSVPAGSVQVSVQYSGPTLVAAANATKLDDLHLHYFLDENAAPYIGTLVPVPAGNPRIVHTAALQVTFDNVTAGSHTVTVMLSGANHVSVAPPLSANVTFTVQ
jgi:hypothetical protein